MIITPHKFIFRLYIPLLYITCYPGMLDKLLLTYIVDVNELDMNKYRRYQKYYSEPRSAYLRGVDI